MALPDLNNGDQFSLFRERINLLSEQTEVATPAIIRGSRDMSRYGAFELGEVDGAQRAINGEALQDGLDDCASNGYWAEFPGGVYEYIAEAVQDGNNVGLLTGVGLKGVIGGGMGESNGARLIQFAANHPVITFGDASNTTTANISGAVYRDLCLGHGVDLTGQTQSCALLISGLKDCKISNIKTWPWLGGTGNRRPYIGIRVGLSTNRYFYDNEVDNLKCNGAQLSLMKVDANGTGNRWGSVHLGTGVWGDLMPLSGPGLDITTSNLPFGSIDQLNVEWINSSFPVIQNRATEFNIDHLHLEGNRINGFNKSLIHIVNGGMNIGSFQSRNNTLKSTYLTGTPAIFTSFGLCNLSVDKLLLYWSGSGYNTDAVADIAFKLYGTGDELGAGRNSVVSIRSVRMTGNTGALHLDANTSGATPGSAGAILDVGAYDFNKALSVTDNMAMTMGNADMTVYGQHRRCRVHASVTLTANRTLTISDKMSATSAAARGDGDVVTVHRTAGGAFDLIVKDAGGNTLGTLAQNTEQTFHITSSSSFSMPAIIRGSLDITNGNSPVAAVVMGALPGTTERTTNGTNFQAALDYVDANGKFLEIPPGRVEYIATGTDASRNVGLQVKSNIRGFVTGGSSESHGTRLVQYATNHPVLTLGRLTSGEGSLLADFLMDGGICLGHGVSQVGQTSADGLLIGGMWSSDLNGTIHVTPFLAGENHPYCAMRVGLSSSNHVFFSNRVEKVQLRGAQANLLVHQSGGTGNVWNQIYAGGGGYDNRMALSSTPIIFRSSGSDIGTIGQLNIEWTASTVTNCGLLLENIDGFFISSLHLEGMKVSASWNARIVSLESAFGQIGTMKALDVWIDSATVDGVPTFFGAYGSCDLKVGQAKLIWNGSGYNATTQANAPFRLYDESTDSSVLGRHPFIDIGHLKVEGHEAAFSLDATLASATYGAVDRVGEYTFTPGMPRTERARINIPSGTTAQTAWGIHRHAQFRKTDTMASSQSLILSDKLMPSGIGAGVNREVGDTVEVVRTAGATGAGALNVRDPANTSTLFAVTAGTVKRFIWNGTAWNVI